ncbi:nitrate transporter 1.6 [Actinidia rufa]|uniref:Nitrate transporter 1.6 n=1 Tax=Actinidia rufa TaxID=165716 RepID=A0A7J0EQC8_9ERIC|nr:nitrate transporter 1.6 [Actinidia rufa]
MEMKDSKQHSISYSWLACCIKCFPISSSQLSLPPRLSPVDELTEKNKAWERNFRAVGVNGAAGQLHDLLDDSVPPGAGLRRQRPQHMDHRRQLLTVGRCLHFRCLYRPVLDHWILLLRFASGNGNFNPNCWVSSTAPSSMHLTTTPTSPMPGPHIISNGSFNPGPWITISIGTGGIRPCNIPFGVDQFDPTTDEGRKGINSFFNWYYTTFTAVLVLALTVVVYIQNNVSWVWGFGIPTFCMVGSIVLFFFGMRVYVYVKPEGSVFTGIVQALVAAYKKRELKIPAESEENVVALYDPSPVATVVTKLPLTSQFRFLNKGAIVLEGEVKTGRVSFERMDTKQRPTDRRSEMHTKDNPRLGIWHYQLRCHSPTIDLHHFTGPQNGPPSRAQVPDPARVAHYHFYGHTWARIGIGLVFSILSMVVAGLVERMRRASAISHGREDGVAPMSVLWLAPQLSLMGFAEAFNIIGQIEFYNRQFPENMSSIANSLFCVTMAGASYISSLLVVILQHVTGSHGRPDWLANDINAGRIDYFYFIIAAMGALNMVYFLVVARRYNYKAVVFANNKDEKSQIDVELNAVKP